MSPQPDSTATRIDEVVASTQEQLEAVCRRKPYGPLCHAHGRIAWGRSEIGGDPIVVVLSERVSDAHLAGLRAEGVS